MLDLLTSLKNVFTVKTLYIDNLVFLLHYKATLVVLCAFCVLVASKQYIGDPIDCIVDEIPENVMDTYCWIYSTFTIPEKLTGKIGQDVAHPGVAPYIHEQDEIKYHKYYQWVAFVLFFQAIFFYVPHYLWKIWENGQIQALLLDLNKPVISNEYKEKHEKKLAKYLSDYLGSHDSYFYKFLLCEMLNFVNIIVQIFFTDFFLDGEFLTYGRDVFRHNHDLIDNNENPMSRVFPKVTKCSFHKYGPSGTVQRFDGLCVLPVNILNEKIYVILWFWFVILAIISGLWFIYRLFYIFNRYVKIYSIGQFKDKNIYKDLFNTFSIGDWFIFYQLRKNMDHLVFNDLFSKVTEEIYKSLSSSGGLPPRKNSTTFPSFESPPTESIPVTSPVPLAMLRSKKN